MIHRHCEKVAETLVCCVGDVYTCSVLAILSNTLYSIADNPRVAEHLYINILNLRITVILYRIIYT